MDYRETKDIRLIPPDTYTTLLKPALDALISLDANPSELLEYVFSKEELEWLKKHHTSH